MKKTENEITESKYRTGKVVDDDLELGMDEGPKMEPLGPALAAKMHEHNVKNFAGYIIEGLVDDYKSTLKSIKRCPEADAEPLWQMKDKIEEDLQSPNTVLMLNLVAENFAPLDPKKIIAELKKVCDFNISDPRAEKSTEKEKAISFFSIKLDPLDRDPNAIINAMTTGLKEKYDSKSNDIEENEPAKVFSR